MTVLTNFSNGGSLKDYRDTFNRMLADIAALKAGSATPTPSPTPTPTPPASVTLTQFKTAAAGVRAGNRRATVLVIGDSTTVGEHGGDNDGRNQMDQDARRFAWPSIFAQRLTAAGLPALANGAMGDAGYDAYKDKPYNSYNRSFDLIGGWSQNNYTSDFWNGLGGSPFYTDANGDFAAFNPGITYDTLKLFAWNTGPTLQLSVNGQEQNFTAPNDGDNTGLSVFTKTASRFADYCYFSKQGGGTLAVQGFHAYDSTVRAVDVINAGVRGSGVGNWVSDFWKHGAFQSIKVVAPDLTIIMPPINDLLGGRTAADFKAKLQAIITEAKKTGDVLLVNAAAIRVGGPDNRPAQAARDAFTTAMRELVTANALPALCDLEALGVWEQGLYYDDLHPLKSRYDAMGRKVAADVLAAIA